MASSLCQQQRLQSSAMATSSSTRCMPSLHTQQRPAVMRCASSSSSSRRMAVAVRAAVTPLPKGVTAPPRNPEAPQARFGFVAWAEKINSRAAMLGFFGILLVEALAHKGIFEMAGFEVGKGLGFEF